jgi:3-oxoacyl-(acyl-carrier-protein) synthase
MLLDVPIPTAVRAIPADPIPGDGVVRVKIRSWDAITVFGDIRETWARLLAGDCIAGHTRVQSLAGANRASRLARSAASKCVGTTRLRPDAAVVVATSKGSIEEWFGAPPPPATAPTSDNVRRGLTPPGLGDIAADLAATFGLHGPALTISAACASGLHALARATLMIRAGEAKQALVVGTEASVHPLFLGSFQRLGVLARPGDWCRPFDRGRTGFHMTEAAAAVLLEADDADGDNAAERICVERYAIGGDATHLTGTDPGARVLRRLLTNVIDGRPVDLIHAHGTGTVLNDATELAAIDACVVGGSGRRRPVVYSHKAALGHSLGASGLLSIVLNCQAHTIGRNPANVRTSDPLPTGRVDIPTTPTDRRYRRSLAIAAGFGGPTAVVSLAVDP